MKIPKIVFIILATTVLLVSGISVYYFMISSQKNQSESSETMVIPPSPYLEVTTWVDQAEFQFDYPKNIEIDKHDEDQENYAQVELKNSDHPGGIIIWVKDLPSGNLEGYLTKAKVQNLIDTTIGGEDAKKGFVSGDQSKITIAMYRDGYLYQIDSNLQDREYWGKIFEMVTTSFQFIEPTLAPDTSTYSNTSDEEDLGFDEEVIE
ncbi:hypothetical protein HYW55_05025 [Candidatus Gottesmanbacteria bacterium]|nr:hypothetical protein [Candidatus Gottesmanbacteria bacterium]